MPFPEHDSSVGHSFGLEFDGVTIKEITQVSGLTMEQDVIELHQNTSDGKYVIKKLPGRPKAGELKVTRGLTEDNNFSKWIKNARLGQMADVRKNGAVIIYDFTGKAALRYKLTNAWASALSIGAMKAGDTGVLEEELTITYEDMEPEA